MHRIFIAINLPEEIKEELSKIQDKFDFDWARRTKKENLHITLEFVGSVSDKELENIFKKAEDFAKKTKAFEVILGKVGYFPDNLLPKYIFATGGKYHITLARIRQWQWKRIESDDRPEIAQTIDLKLKANSIEVMESFLKRGGPEYRILESYPLL